MFTHSTTVRLYDTDAAGLLFFANHFRVSHDAYEAFLEAHGLPLCDMINGKEVLVPIVEATSEYTSPAYSGDHITVELTAERVSEHSYTLRYNLLKDSGELVSRIKTVHVCTDPDIGQKKPLPQKLRTALETLLDNS